MLGHKSTGKSLSRTGQLCVIERTSSVADVAALTTASIVALSCRTEPLSRCLHWLCAAIRCTAAE